MPVFQYVAYNEHGRREVGIGEFASEIQAYEGIASQGLTVIELAQASTLGAGAPKRNVWGALFERRIPTSQQAELADQLAVLFGAHLAARDVVRVITAGSERVAIKRHFRRLGRLLEDGTDFPSAFQRAGSGFSPIFYALLLIGQDSRDLVPLLRSLAGYLRRQDKFRSQISESLIYPALLVLGAILMLLFVVLYLAPSLAPMFVSLDRPIPAVLSFFLAIGSIIQSSTTLLFAASVTAGGVIVVLSQIDAGFIPLKKLESRLPLWGRITRTGSLARLTRATELLLAAGVPLAKSLRDTARILGREPYAPLFARAADALEGGQTASEAFREDRSIPVLFMEMVKLGEETNTLPGILSTLATSLEEQQDRQMQRFTRLITPILTLVIGGAIAALVYSVMGAILSINDLAF